MSSFPSENEVAVPKAAFAALRMSRGKMTVLLLGMAAAVAIAEGVYILNVIRQPPAAVVIPPMTATMAIAAPAPSPPSPVDSVAGTVTDITATVGRLLVRSEPSGAEVFLDGRKLGLTPVTLEKVPPGVRQLLVRRAGAELRQTVRIEAGATLSVLAPLVPRPTDIGSGYLAIVAPIDVDVFEEGTLLGTSRSKRIMLEAGAHNLVLVNEQLGFRQAQAVRIEVGQTAPVAIEVPQSAIYINARPWAEVLIDGKPVGETPIGNLPIAIGIHELVFRHPQLGERKMKTTVSATAPTRVVVDFSNTSGQR